MILVDTSVWVDYFNGKKSKQTDQLDYYLSEDRILVGDLILIEILQGFTSDKNYRIAKDFMENLEYVPLLNKELAYECSNNYRLLRKKGLTVRKTIDVVIATYCMAHNIPLLHNDRDFDIFEKYLGLDVL
jgi:hypothetical protein